MTYISNGVMRGEKVDISMPYAGWASLLQNITDASYHEWGAAKWNQTVKGPGRATFEVRERIAKRINEMDAHPAILGQGVVGQAFERLVAWQTQYGYEPYYLDLGVMVVLLPRHIDAPTLEHEGFSFVEPSGITVWEAHPLSQSSISVDHPEGLFLNEADHRGW